MTDVATLEKRLDSVERSLRTWRRVAASAAILALVTAAIVGREAVRARSELRITSVDGARTAVLDATGLAFAGADPAGPRARVGADANGAVVSLGTLKSDARLTANTGGTDLRMESGAQSAVLAATAHSADIGVTSGNESVVARAPDGSGATVTLGNAGPGGLVTIDSGGTRFAPRLQLANGSAPGSFLVLEAQKTSANVQLADTNGRRTIGSVP